MKKTLEYFYIFSKLSTSFILLLCILILGYFFYMSFKNQEKTNNDQAEVINKLNYNSDKITNLSKKIEMTDTFIYEIKKTTKNNTNIKNSKEIISLNKKIEELNLKLKNLTVNLEEIQTQKKPYPNNIKVDVPDKILNKNKTELAKLVILKFENNLDFTDEINILQNLNDQSKQNIFEKINLISLNKFRGNSFIKNIFIQEFDLFLKENLNNKLSNFFPKSLMKIISIKPSKINIINNNDIKILNEVTNHLDQKNYKISYQKIINIINYEKYFTETINQIKIFIEFEELINKVS